MASTQVHTPGWHQNWVKATPSVRIHEDSVNYHGHVGITTHTETQSLARGNQGGEKLEVGRRVRGQVRLGSRDRQRGIQPDIHTGLLLDYTAVAEIIFISALMYFFSVFMIFVLLFGWCFIGFVILYSFVTQRALVVGHLINVINKNDRKDNQRQLDISSAE